TRMKQISRLKLAFTASPSSWDISAKWAADSASFKNGTIMSSCLAGWGTGTVHARVRDEISVYAYVGNWRVAIVQAAGNGFYRKRNRFSRINRSTWRRNALGKRVLLRMAAAWNSTSARHDPN